VKSLNFSFPHIGYVFIYLIYLPQCVPQFVGNPFCLQFSIIHEREKESFKRVIREVRSLRAAEDGSCLGPRGHCDRPHYCQACLKSGNAKPNHKCC
jgi:hypothetical protein